jgi:hypothetical protein
MPEPIDPGQPNIVPTTPQVQAVGQAEDMLGQQVGNQQRTRKTQAQIRQEALQRIAEQKNPLFRRIYYKTIQKGALTNFQYVFWKHDPYPLVLCSSIYHDGKVAGINLHYLTFKYIKYLIQQYCGKQFSYPLIKNNTFIYNAFRTYKRQGVRNAKLMDCEFLMTLLGTIRSFRPSEIEAIRQEVQRQLRARMNPTSQETAEEYSGIVVPDPFHKKYADIEGYAPLDRYGEPIWPNAVPPLKKEKPTLGDGRFNPDNLMPPP